MPIPGHFFKPPNVGATARHGLLQLTCLGRPQPSLNRHSLRASVFTTAVGNGSWLTAFGLALLHAEMGPQPPITDKLSRIPVAPETSRKGRYFGTRVFTRRQHRMPALRTMPGANPPIRLTHWSPVRPAACPSGHLPIWSDFRGSMFSGRVPRMRRPCSMAAMQHLDRPAA